MQDQGSEKKHAHDPSCECPDMDKFDMNKEEKVETKSGGEQKEDKEKLDSDKECEDDEECETSGS